MHKVLLTTLVNLLVIKPWIAKPNKVATALVCQGSSNNLVFKSWFETKFETI